MNLQEIHEWVFDELGFCGCGDPEAALDFLRSVLAAIHKRSKDNDGDIHDADSAELWKQNSEAIRELIGMETAPAMAWTYLYFLDSKGLLEHGGNCSGSWLTEKGENILAALNAHSTESIIENETDILDAAEVI